MVKRNRFYELQIMTVASAGLENFRRDLQPFGIWVADGNRTQDAFPEAIKNFNEKAAINYFNNFHEGSVNNGTVGSTNYNCSFNPIDKIVELYDALLKSEREKTELLQKLLNNK